MKKEPYAGLSREELIRTIEELRTENGRLVSSADKGGKSGSFKEKYAVKILESIPDMITVLSHSGELVDMVSSEETNHVGVPSCQIIGMDIKDMLSSDAYQSVRSNLEQVVSSGKGSASHHDITLDNQTHHYENRIYPLDKDYALCICRDVTEETDMKDELRLANHRMSRAEDIAGLNHWYYYEKTEEFEAPRIIPKLSGIKSPEQIRSGKNFFLSHVHPADREKLETQFSDPQVTEDYVEYRIQLDGKIKYMHSRIIQVYEKDGEKVVEGYA